jgi:hypothetical protein
MNDVTFVLWAVWMLGSFVLVVVSIVNIVCRARQS